MSRQLLTALVLAHALAGAACTGVIADDPDDGGGGGGDDDDVGGDDDAPHPSDVLFDETVVHRFDLTVAPDDWEWLKDHATLEQYVPAQLGFEGETFAEASVRYKGSTGSLDTCYSGSGTMRCDKLNLKVSFNETIEDGEFHGVRKLNFHGMWRDQARMREMIAYRLFRDAGVFAPRTAYARLYVNGEDQGVFVLVENVDGRFARKNFPDGGEGNLYKEVWPVGTDADPYLDALETNEDDAPSVDRVVRFATELDDAGSGGFVGVADRWGVLDSLAKNMAVERLVDNWDDMTAWYCEGGSCGNHNYYWYESTTDDRLWLVPWDFDFSLRYPSPLRNDAYPEWDEPPANCAGYVYVNGYPMRVPSCDPLIGGLATKAHDRYDAASRALIDGAFSADALEARIDQLAALLAPEIATDEHGPSVTEWNGEVDDLRAITAHYRDFVESRLDAE